ncbi:DegT/DnrJ/EryC1/StrS family aminotransferase [Thermomonas sp. RSS23]|uniref:DegT/DnrJ/EryC1/StrS family aminotransferase n=1 Tax=Thermomonas beijingensis TaxID=2872701 RepID=A0ABS7TCK9_9GAMM|nr:DegT/DnrJ/EryC1/StrS family aminotransferase [Thermomonas beijingensis]MBZ4185600.1 DegT/DnrJ/EryC1/StrS family aminotransferase [Thermomonas beijingensis]
MEWKVQLFKLNYDQREADAVADVIRSGWLTMGERTVAFEREFAAYLGAGTMAAAVSNGTAALHLALLALDIGPGDEVIVPAQTFVADINAVMLVGATPVMADCTSFEDWNMDPADIERKITDRTRAVLIVHYAGVPCDMDAIVSLCQRKGLKLIEDCAHAPGASYKGRSVGTFGDVGCWSFFTNKNLSVGEGGMVTTRSDDLDREMRYLRSHGMTTLTLDRHKGRAVTYDVVRPGLNYRIDEIRAALGLVQLAKLDAANASRRKIVEAYRREIGGLEGVALPFPDRDDRVASSHIFPILLREGIERLEVVESLKADGVQSSIHYPAIHHFTAYSGMDLGATPIADEVAKRELTLPLYPDMTEGDVQVVADALRKALVKIG